MFIHFLSQNKSINSRRQHGLTILELTIVIIITALVIGTATPAYLHIVESRRIDFTINEITDMQRDIDRFSRRNNRYPDNLTEIYPTVPFDPWGNTYKYLNIATSQANPRTDNNLKPVNSDYDLYSEGPDTISLSPIQANESRDDIIRAQNGNFVGVAADFRQ